MAIIAAYNERRFIRACIENLIQNKVDVYLIDNESSDDTLEIAQTFLGKGLIGVESLPREGRYTWARLLERKAEIAHTLDYDWSMHVDADEIRLPPPGSQTLSDAVAQVEARGFNAINFIEFAFVPTVEAPNHDHPDFTSTMRHYYPFLPAHLNRMNLWKRQTDKVDLVTSGGHSVDFPNIHPFPNAFPMRHYLFLSVDHAIEKWICRRYDQAEIQAGWHRSRAQLRPEDIWLQSQAELRFDAGTGGLDATNPLKQHPVFSQRPHETLVALKVSIIH